MIPVAVLLVDYVEFTAIHEGDSRRIRLTNRKCGINRIALNCRLTDDAEIAVRIPIQQSQSG
jgi:hypothetical protein